jgi:hypothetical protein
MKRILLELCICLNLLIQGCNNGESPKPGENISFDIKENYTDTCFRVNKIIQLSDSGYILAGGASTGNGKFQNLFMKYDPAGKRVWVNIKSHSDSPKGFCEIIKLNENKLYAYRDYGFNYDPSPRIVEYNGKGKMIFQNIIGIGIKMNSLVFIPYDYFIAGQDQGHLAYQKLDTGARSKWIKRYSFAPAGLSITQTEDNNFISIAGGNDSGNGNYLIKIDPEGDTIWTRNYKGYVVKALSDGNFLAITGTGSNIDFIMFDNPGNEKWKIQYTDASISSFTAGCLNILDFDSGYYVFTMLKDDGIFYIYVFNKSGKLTKTDQISDISTNDQLAIAKTIDEGIIVVKSNISNTSKIFEIIKLPKVTS